jgi:hypothetical protein
VSMCLSMVGDVNGVSRFVVFGRGRCLEAGGGPFAKRQKPEVSTGTPAREKETQATKETTGLA